MTPACRVAVLLLLGALAAPQPGAAQEAKHTPPQGSMTFALTGDAIITRRLSPFREREFLEMIEVIRRADAAFTNLEVLFHTYDEGYPTVESGGTWMAAEPSLAKELVWAGFDLVSLANNHTMDYGAGGLRSTMDALDAAGLVHAGAGHNLERARAPAYLETAGGRVALISVASTFSAEDRAGRARGDVPGRPGLSPLRYTTTYTVSRASLDALRKVAQEAGIRAGGDHDRLVFLGATFVAGEPAGVRTAPHPGDLAEIIAAVQDARRQADWVLVTSHSHEGAASREVPAEFLVTFARAVIDAGADLFVGHGPHVLRGVEIYKGKPVFYSLANFIFQNETVRFLPADFYDQYDLPPGATPADAQDARIQRSRTGGFPGDPAYWESVIAEPRFVDGALQEVRLYPITLGYGKPRPQRGRPLLASPADGRRIIERLANLSAPFGTEVRYLPAENVGVITVAAAADGQP